MDMRCESKRFSRRHLTEPPARCLALPDLRQRGPPSVIVLSLYSRIPRCLHVHNYKDISRMAIAIALVLLVVGSVVFHFVSPWWFTDIASHWSNIDFTINLTFWVTGFVFIAVNLFLAYSVYRFRQKKDQPHQAVYEPENAKLETGLILATTVGIAAMLALGLFVWAQFVTVPDDAVEFEAFASQWQWSFRYPGEDGVLGTADIQYITERNPWGVNPNDPNGQDDIVIKAPFMALPIDQSVKIL